MSEFHRGEFLAGELRPRKRGGALRWAAVWLICCMAAGLLAPGLLGRIRPPAPQNAGRPAVRLTSRSAPALVTNTTSVSADQNGHFYVDADVDGAAVRFLVDTGATYVVLSDADAEAAGVNRAALTFDRRMSTANGETRGALLTLRRIRIGQMELNQVQAMLLESSPPISLLGMSFLKRLDHYDIHDGQMLLAW